MKLVKSMATICYLMFSVGAGGQQPTVVSDIVEEQQRYQQDAQQTQLRIDELDDETITMVSNYNRELKRYEDLLAYNENMRQLLQSQADERARITNELDEVEVVRREIVPLIVEMVDVLSQYVELDQPMLVQERAARVETLQAILTRSDVDTAEKYRRVMEAYQIEAEYGQSLEAYEGPVEISGRELTVDFLRVGRVGLYYLSLDRQEAGIWSPSIRSWQALPDRYLNSLDFAVRVAREQAPPNLIELPLWTGSKAQ